MIATDTQLTDLETCDREVRRIISLLETTYTLTPKAAKRLWWVSEFINTKLNAAYADRYVLARKTGRLRPEP